MEKILKNKKLDPSELIEILQDIQAEQGYLPEEMLIEVSKNLKYH